MAHSCQGAGLGLRPPHLFQVCREQPAVPWFEVHICNYLGGGLNRALLQEVAKHYPLSFHGVNLSLGGTDPLNHQYLKLLRQAVDEFQPALVSEHASFSSHGGQQFHDLLPVPYTRDAARHMANRIRQVQDTIGRRILIENVSRYYSYSESDMPEGEFLAAVCEEADCGLLLDLNNAWVNYRNLGEDPYALLRSLPLERVEEIHLAGYSEQGELLIDTHSSEPCEAVWDLFQSFCELRPDIPCLIEWDSDLPSLEILMTLQHQAAQILLSSAAQPTRATA